MVSIWQSQGVLADYAAEQALKEAERDAKAAMRQAVLDRMVHGAKADTVQPPPPPQVSN